MFYAVVMSAYNKVQPVSKGEQESGECSKGNGEITAISDSRRHTLHSFQLGSTSRPCKTLVHVLLYVCMSVWLFYIYVCLSETLNCLMSTYVSLFFCQLFNFSFAFSLVDENV